MTHVILDGRGPMAKRTGVGERVGMLKAACETVGLAAPASLVLSVPFVTATTESVLWWVPSPAIKRVTQKSGTHFAQLSLDPATSSAALDNLLAEGIATVDLHTRRRLRTGDDAKPYAFLRTAKVGSERILAVLNFQPTPQEVVVDLSPVATSGLVDLRDGTQFPRQTSFHVTLAAYGYRVMQVLKSPGPVQ